MAGVMATQTGLIYAVENKPSMKTQAGIGAAAMLFIFQGGKSNAPSLLAILHRR